MWQPTNKKIGGWWEYYLSPNDTLNQKEGDESITSHPMRPETKLNHGKQQTFDARTGDESIEQDLFVIFHGICSVFCTFLIFFDIYGFPALLVFCWGGDRACNKIELCEMSFGDASITSHLIFAVFFPNMTSQSQPTNITARVQLLTACKPLCLKSMRIEL